MMLVYPSLDSPETVEGTCNQQKLIGLRLCAGCAESSLVAKALLLVLSCAGFIMVIIIIIIIIIYATLE